MNVFHTIDEFRAYRLALPAAGKTPFVPTMGALHEGHASLVQHARAMLPPEKSSGDAVVTSIFVNPAQFGPQEDFSRYPRTLDADLALLEKNGADAVFVPSAQEMYPSLGSQEPGLATHTFAAATSIDPGPLAQILEGTIRPGHFHGVCTVVAKLLNIIQPTHLLLGQKDYQQQAILRQMCADLNFPAEVILCPTLRESDGLAMSSRNRYLNSDERTRAVAIYEALIGAKLHFDQGERQASVLEAEMQQHLAARGLIVQYATVADPQTLRPLRETLSGRITSPAVLLIAAKLGQTRLIDNMLL